MLQRNPQYPVVHYDAQPAADDAEGQALLARFRGRPLPLVDRVEIAIIEANQPRWLAFLNGSLDHVELPTDFIDRAMPNRTLAPYLAQQGIRG